MSFGRFWVMVLLSERRSPRSETKDTPPKSSFFSPRERDRQAIPQQEFPAGLLFRWERSFPRQFQNVEAGTEVAGVREGLELAQPGRIRLAFLSEQPIAGEGGEP